jgi:hypothetical protein
MKTIMQVSKYAPLLVLLGVVIFFPYSWVARAGGPGFQPAEKFPAGTPDGLVYGSAATIPVVENSAPQGVYAADFNGDGVMDLAVLGPRSVQVLLGQGGGVFTLSFVYKLPNRGEPTGFVLAADFNHDDKMDVAFSVTGTSGQIGVLLGNGDGTFEKPLFVNHLNGPNQFASADFNGDGNPDLVIQLVQGSQVAVLPGNGDGTFGAPMLETVGNGGSPLGYVLPGDYNKDGNQDILVLGAQDCVLLGAGNGTFSQGPCTMDSGSTGVGVIGDFNQDGNQDIADIEGSSPYGVNILLGNGDGSFQAPVEYPVDFLPVGLETASLRNNGTLDIVAASGSGLFSSLAGNGDGTFRPQGSHYIQGGTGTEFALSDFTGDNLPDAGFGLGGCDSVTLAQGNGDTTFQAAQAFATVPYLPSFAGIVAADFNGDGNMDAATADSTGVTVSLGNGDGTFQPATGNIPTGTTSPGGILAGDFNGDGITDLAVLGQQGGGDSGVQLLFGNGDGTFQPPVNFAAGARPVKFVSADFNQDGNPDFAVLDFCTGKNCSGGDGVTILLGDGHGNFTSEGPYVVGEAGPQTIIAGNFNSNSDAFPDVAVLSTSKQGKAYASVMLNNGDGTLGAPSNIYFASLSGIIISMITADMNVDGIPDLIVTAEQLLNGDSSLFVLLGRGDGTFKPGIKNRRGHADTPAVTDANDDGIPDLVYPAVNSFRFVLGLGGGALTRMPPSLPSTPLNTVIVTDLNNDGMPDLLAVGNSGTGGTLYLESLLNRESGGRRAPINSMAHMTPVTKTSSLGPGK